MRNFLINQKIVGAVSVSKNPEISEMVIKNLLKYCDWILVMVDNESEEIIEKVLELQKEHYNRMFVRRSSMPHKIIRRNGEVLPTRNRWKCVKGWVRDEIFVNLKRIQKYTSDKFKDIDILLFLDADEIFTNHLSVLLENFWESEYKAIAFRHIHVVNDLMTIKKDTMRPHVHAWKWTPDICGIPWQWQNQMHPFTWDETLKANYYSAHLCYLTSEERKWRKDNWKKNNLDGCDLWTLDKPVYELSPQEIKDTFNRKPDKKYA